MYIMKKFHFPLMMTVLLSGLMTSCNNDEPMSEPGSGDASEMLAKLNALLVFDEDGELCELVDPYTGNYCIAADDQKQADELVNKYSLGAEKMEGQKLVLPENLGTITVKSNKARGHFYDIEYDVKSIGTEPFVLEVVAEQFVNDENLPIPLAPADDAYVYHCMHKDCDYVLNVKASDKETLLSIAQSIKEIVCPRCETKGSLCGHDPETHAAHGNFKGTSNYKKCSNKDKM